VGAALHTTLERGFGQTHCLCHGDFGNLELILQASRASHLPSAGIDFDTLTAMILDSVERHGWQCGGPPGVVLPGLMLGVAGIGYELLRIAEPAFVPSVLTLAPPAD
jgi:lantibiotic modifying enzyme